VSQRPDRRTALLDAALALIAESGLRSVTHRAVEARVGLPHGSTTYYFKSHEQLVEAAVDRLNEIDHAGVDTIGRELALELAIGRGELNIDRFAAALTAWIRQRPDVQLVRYELSLAGTRRPEIAAKMRASRASFIRLLMPVAVSVGAADPERDADTLLSLINGLIFDELTSREPGHEPAITARDLARVIRAIDKQT
jgi:AcrR family transcriptional regulator